MKTLLKTAMIFALAAALHAGEVLDRIVATVNRQPILKSDWEEALRYECFLNQRPLTTLTAGESKAALRRLIDQTLLSQQMKAAATPPAADADLAARIREIRNQLRGAQDNARWQEALARYGLTEGVFRDHLALQLETMRFVDLKFRPAIRIDPASVEAYYKEQLLPQLQQKGKQPTPELSTVSPKIEEVLVQKKMDEMLTAWLVTLRTQSSVDMR